MLKRLGVLLLLSLLSMPLSAEEPQGLAMQTFSLVKETDAVLMQVIAAGTAKDYRHNIHQPIIEMVRKWPRFGDKRYDAFSPCRIMLDSFRHYSDAQFKAKGHLTADSPLVKVYHSDLRSCQAMVEQA